MTIHVRTEAGRAVSRLRRIARRATFAPLALALALAGLDGEASATKLLTGPRVGLGSIRIASPEIAPRPFAICSDQTYALCATAKCLVFNGIAYCRCDVEHGDSISLPFDYAPGKNACTANAEGVGNGYMLSTYSLPSSVLPPDGDQALYTCPASTSNGAYAQCDGGYCFQSTRGQSFPSFAEPLADDEIICSCPITVANPETAFLGFQIVGPYPCQQSFFANCKNPPAGNSTGDTIYVGAPSGAAAFLTELLYGEVPPFHRCEPSEG